MEYVELCKVYSELEATTKGLEKTKILAEFLKKLRKEKDYEVVYLLKGQIFADYDSREIGVSDQLAIKAIAKVSGLNVEEINDLYRELGELGLVAEKVVEKRKQSSLFSGKLDVEKVLNNLQKIPDLEGQGTVDRKIGLIVELLNSASGVEAKYVIRTVLGDLKIGVGNGLLRDAIVDACFSYDNIDEKKEKINLVQEAYDKATDFALVFEKACVNKLEDISLTPGKPLKVMLYPKAKDIDDAFRIVGKPAAFEYKYDGFRVMINKNSEGIKVFTRRLDDVTTQFPDIVKFVSEHVNAKNFILDAEAVGYSPKTKEYRDFQYISQRIKRKYDIEKLQKELPVELKVFDIVFCDDKSLINSEFIERRNLLKNIVKEKKFEIVLAEQIVSSDEKEVQEFFDNALEEGQEGLMAKRLDAPYKPGARVGYAVKLKPVDKDFDLVITGAEWGTGKRAGWLTSFDVSVRDDETGELKEIGKVSTGLKEKKEQGLSFEEMTDLLRDKILEQKGRKVKLKEEVVVSVQYQNIQKSPTYSSGFALRFPRITRLRPDRNKEDVATLEEVRKEVER